MAEILTHKALAGPHDPFHGNEFNGHEVCPDVSSCELGEESDGPLQESMCGESEDMEEEELEDAVVEDMQKLEESFRGFNRKYRLINRIGEGKPISQVCLGGF